MVIVGWVRGIGVFFDHTQIIDRFLYYRESEDNTKWIRIICRYFMGLGMVVFFAWGLVIGWWFWVYSESYLQVELCAFHGTGGCDTSCFHQSLPNYLDTLCLSLLNLPTPRPSPKPIAQLPSCHTWITSRIGLVTNEVFIITKLTYHPGISRQQRDCRGFTIVNTPWLAASEAPIARWSLCATSELALATADTLPVLIRLCAQRCVFIQRFCRATLARCISQVGTSGTRLMLISIAIQVACVMTSFADLGKPGRIVVGRSRAQWLLGRIASLKPRPLIIMWLIVLAQERHWSIRRREGLLGPILRWRMEIVEECTSMNWVDKAEKIVDRFDLLQWAGGWLMAAIWEISVREAIGSLLLLQSRASQSRIMILYTKAQQIWLCLQWWDIGWDGCLCIICSWSEAIRRLFVGVWYIQSLVHPRLFDSI